MGLPCQWLYAYAVDSLQREAANVIFLTYRSVSVSLMRQGDPREGLGEEMYEAFKNKTKIPQADVEITDDDPPEVRRMKELIVEMTAYEASKRPTIQQVLAVLKELNDQVRHERKC